MKKTASTAAAGFRIEGAQDAKKEILGQYSPALEMEVRPARSPPGEMVWLLHLHGIAECF